MLSRRHKRAIIGFTALTLLGAVLLFAVGRFFAGRSLELQLAEERANLRPPEPMVIAVKRDSLERRRTFAARAEPWIQATLAPEVAGTVIRLGSDVGAKVVAGADVLELESSAARAMAAAARTQAEEAQRRQREVEQLVRQQATATNDAPAAAAAAAAAEREAERSAVILEKYRLRAPFAGTIQTRRVDVGDFLNVGQMAFELVDLSRLRVVFHAGETEISAFAVGKPLDVTFPSLRGRRGQAIVRHVAPATGPNGLFRIEAEYDNRSGEVPGGIAATVETVVQLYRDALFIPTAAVRLEGARAVVLRARNEGAAEPVTVEIGPEIGGRFPIIRGLNEGDRLIVR